MYPDSAGIVIKRVRLDGTASLPIPATAGAPIWKSWVRIKYMKTYAYGFGPWAASAETDLTFGLTTPHTRKRLMKLVHRCSPQDHCR